MGLFRSLSGSVSATLTSADIPGVLSVVRLSGIELRNIRETDLLSVSFEIKRSDTDRLKRIVQRRNGELRLNKNQGLYWTFVGLCKRPILVLGLSVILLLSLFLPGKILFVRVEGNNAVPGRLIMEHAAKQGVNLGAAARALRSEQIKNALLSEIEGLQWVGINTYGCVAVISVRERAIEPEEEALPPVTSIAADRDGIIQTITVTKGTALCKPGDAVVTGQTLISGYTDLGICLQGTQARGEIIALTQRQITVVTPSFYSKRGEQSKISRNFALLIGKKRINFYKGSGILDTSCARIYSQWYVTLPGGFILPFGIACETCITYQPAEEQAATDFDISAFSAQYLLDHMTAGEILSSSHILEKGSDTITFRGYYACREMLGITRIEEDFENYGKDP